MMKSETRLVLGNRDARNLVTVGAQVARSRHVDPADPARLHAVDDAAGTGELSVPIEQNTATIVVFPADASLGDMFTDVTKPGQGVWSAHTHTDTSKPAWVASDSAGLASLLAEHYGCPVRDLNEDEVVATFGGSR